MPKKLVQNGDARRAEIIERAGFLLHDSRSRPSRSGCSGVPNAKEAKSKVSMSLQHIVNPFFIIAMFWREQFKQFDELIDSKTLC